MVAPGVDFLLNFVSATDFGATTPQPVVNDGRDVLFGDGGNDWLVGGTNSDVLFGGWGNDVLQADDNLDSTRVDVPVTTDSLCTLVGSYSSEPHTTSTSATTCLTSRPRSAARTAPTSRVRSTTGRSRSRARSATRSPPTRPRP